MLQTSVVSPSPVVAGQPVGLSKTFLFAGRACFTVANPAGDQYTFRVNGRESMWNGAKSTVYFLSVKAPGGKWAYQYIGMVNPQTGVVKVTGKSVFQPGSKEFNVGAWACEAVAQGKLIRAGYRILPSSKCARCGKKLTDITSITRGIGPECWSKAGGN